LVLLFLSAHCHQGAESDVSFETMDGSAMRIGIIRTRWNEKHVKSLNAACIQALKDCQVDEANIFETSVPGSYELPLAARFLALSGTVDAIVCIGVLIKGQTMHFEYISDAVVRLTFCPFFVFFFTFLMVSLFLISAYSQ
jgi:6,7-dimethyl-8-ribityllumazine synthase